MKRLVALMMCAVSLGAAAQFPNLPYNPDENGDGLIGVVDLQGLLANYGSEFTSVALSSSGEMAVTQVGQMPYLKCRTSCASLPGMWSIIDENSAGLAMYSLDFGGGYAWVDLNSHHLSVGSESWYAIANVVNSYGSVEQYLDAQWSMEFRCFCSTEQLPRVEYEFCAPFVGNVEGFRTCCQDLVSDGWYPLNVDPGSGTTRSNSTVLGQAFWRWAE